MIIKHTPGPWWCNRIGNTHDHWLVYSEPNGQDVVHSCEGEANAHLIAAAPELLAACLSYREHLRLSGGSDPLLDEALNKVMERKH